MTYEESLKKVYEGTFEILKRMGDPERTRQAQPLLRHFFANYLLEVQGEKIPSGKAYNLAARKINEEYEKALDTLVEKQEIKNSDEGGTSI